jgi:hypothetical protein
MGWWDDIKGWGRSLYNNAPLANGVNNVGSYSYKSVLGLFELVNATPKAVHSVAFHPKTRMVAGHATRIIAEDLLPLVAVTYFNKCIQDMNRYPSDEGDNSGFVSVDTAIGMGLGLLQLATWAISARKKMQIKVRMAVVAMEAGKAFNGVRKDHLKTRCIEEQCSPIRFIQGSLRDTISYFATEAAISLVGYIPYVGGAISAVLSIHHHGRYIMTIILPNLCNEHQIEMLTEYSEDAFALGLGHAALTFLAVHGIESITHVPRSFYESAVQEFMMITTLCAAAHMRLPPAITKRGFIKMMAEPETMDTEELDILIKHRPAYVSSNSKLSFIKVDVDGDLKIVSLCAKNSQLEALFTGRNNELIDASKEDLMIMTSLTGHSSFRSQLNPVALFQAGLGFVVDTFILGLKKQIPRLLRQPSSSSSWDVIVYKMVDIWQHPYAQKIEFLFLPGMLRNSHAFIKDPVVAPNWDELRTTLIVAIENIEEIRGKYYVRIGVAVGSWKPEVTAKITDLLFGAPKTVVKLVLKLMSNDDFMSQLSSARRKLECLDVGEAVEINPNPLALEVREENPFNLSEEVKIDEEEPTRKATSDPEKIIRIKNKMPSISDSIFDKKPVKKEIKAGGFAGQITQKIVEKSREQGESTRKMTLDPEKVIRIKNKMPSISNSIIDKKPIETTVKKEIKAEHIIGRTTQGIFKNPESVIRLRTAKKTRLEDTLELSGSEMTDTKRMSQ